MNFWTQSPNNIFVAAHRGWKDKYPENTLEAFSAAMELGVDQLETDIRITKDGHLVLIHDETVDRTTNGTGKVCDLTLEQLQALDAGNGTKIPTLTQFMELVKDHPTITVDLELKEYPVDGRDEIAYSVCDRVLKMVDDYGFTDRCVINSWNGKLNEYVHRVYGNKYKQHVYFPQFYLGPCAVNPYDYAYCACVFGLDRGEITLEDVHNLYRDTGVRVWAGTYAKDEASIDLAVKMGVELITCNNPDEVLAILRSKGLHK